MFFLKDKNKERTSIEAIIRYKGQRYKLATGESVEVKMWNTERERCLTGRKYSDGVFVNDKLDVIEADLKRVVNDFNLRNEIPTLKELKEAYEKLKGNDNSKVYFTDFLKERIELSKQNRSHLTVRSYTTTLNKLFEYEKRTGKRLKFADIDMDFYFSFKQYFYEQGNTRNYFGTMIKNIKKFMNDGLIDGIHTSEGHKHPHFIIQAEDVDTIYLDMDELERIYKLKIDEGLIKSHYPDIYAQNMSRKIEALKFVRARFLIGAFTLLRVSDYKRLTDVNIKDGVIRIKPKKRSKGRMNRDVVIPMHPVVKEILESGFDMTKEISEQKLNKHIKELCKMAGLTQIESVVKTENDKEVERQYEKWELVTSHTARRSAATNMLMSGVEASDIMILGWWSSEKSFWKYIRLEPEMNARRLAGHAFFSTSKKD